MSKSGSKCAAIAAGAILLIAAAAQAGVAPVNIAIGSATGKAADVVSIDVTLATNAQTCDLRYENVDSAEACANKATEQVCGDSSYNAETRVCNVTGCLCAVGTQNDMTFAPPLAVVRKSNGRPDCAFNAEINKGSGGFSFLPSGCTVGSCTGMRALVLSVDDTSPIPSGAVLYTCKVSIAGDATPGEYPLGCEQQGSSSATGGPLETTCDGGVVTVPAAPTDTPTATQTPIPTNTATRTQTATPSNTGTVTNTPTATNTSSQNFDNNDCAITAPGQAGNGWLLLLPAVALLWLRRRSR